MQPKKIIIEGDWGVGKTTLLEYLRRQFSYDAIDEPLHRKNGVPDADATGWYVEQHKLRTNVLNVKDISVAMERSILSSIAFQYASGTEVNVLKKYRPDIDALMVERPLAVYLYSDVKKIERETDDLVLRNAFASPNFFSRYHYFYTDVLPFEFGITPICINTIIEGKKKDVADIAKNIFSANDCNRLAQINVVCFRKEDDGSIQFLLLKRNERKGGFWQTITGGVKLHQPLPKALAAELNEEVGVTFAEGRCVKTGFSFNYIGGEGYELHEYVFGYEVGRDEKVVLSDEHTEFRWTTEGEAIVLLKYDGNKNAVRLLKEKLAKQ